MPLQFLLLYRIIIHSCIQYTSHICGDFFSTVLLEKIVPVFCLIKLHSLSLQSLSLKCCITLCIIAIIIDNMHTSSTENSCNTSFHTIIFCQISKPPMTNLTTKLNLTFLLLVKSGSLPFIYYYTA